MDTTLPLPSADASPAPAAGPAPDAPRNLLGRPATRHRGTEIDGATLAPEGLWVRDRNLNDLIGTTSFEHALAHLWFDRHADDARTAAIRQRLGALGASFAHGSAAQDVAANLGAAGVEPVFAAAAGLLRGLDDAIVRAAGEPLGDPDLDAMLACAAAAPFLLRAAIDGRPFAVSTGARRIDAGLSHAQRMLVLTGASRHDPLAERVMDALLVAWHAGFGYITPTVLAPRVAIGTGVTLTQAIAAGFMASGPSHVGAALEALDWLQSLAATLAPGERTPDALRRASAGAVDRIFDADGALLFGFGHPLFVADPRPPHLRALFAGWDLSGPYLTLFDACCARAAERKHLNPNIDFLTATALLELGVTVPSWGVGVGLCSRIAAMAAHAVERRQRPAFGVTSATARKLLAAVPVGWL
ncbi:citrate/2-methylcitrate synthase [Burkholderia alba]|uniref:citrate/2-methylcitrate synthase n=1 Tax=Burkholderia alba TaxID=2683677 RepID=UPI002B056195|nr:citrate/2-methylcitrate synthase [Burkholderia alba]